MRFQKGQSIVEFALILPFFIFFLFGIIYFGMGFADYVALNDIARGSARAASISTDKAPYESIKDEYKKQPLPANLYEVKEFQIDDLKSGTDPNAKVKNVQVTIKAKLPEDKNSLAQIFRNILGEKSLFDINIQYIMYKEPSSSS